MKNLAISILAAAIVTSAAAAFVLAGDAERLNALTHCHADGAPCVADCSTAEPVAEDDACWLIVSPDSGLEVSWALELFGARDYRP